MLAASPPSPRQLSHYQRRGELRDHPSYRMITDRDTKDQLQVLL